MAEVLVAMIGYAIIAGVVLSLMKASSETVSTSSRLGAIQEDARQAIDRLAGEMRWADRDTFLLTTENGSSRVDFRVPVDNGPSGVVWSTTIVFRCEPSTVDANRNGIQDEDMLVRIQDGVTQVMCHRVPSGGLSVQRTDDNVVVQLDLSQLDDQRRAVNVTRQSSISLRNGSL